MVFRNECINEGIRHVYNRVDRRETVVGPFKYSDNHRLFTVSRSGSARCI